MSTPGYSTTSSPWAADKEVAEVIRPVLVQVVDTVLPKSPGSGHDIRKVTIEDLGCCGSGAGCKTEPRARAASYHAQCRGPGIGTNWTAMHKPDITCALRKGNDGDMCEQSLAKHPFHPCCCNYGEPGPDRIAQSSAHCAGSSSSLSSTIG